MEEKYMTKILTFSNDIIGRGEELIINREQAKGIIKELEQDYVPKAIIKNKLKELENKEKEMSDEQGYWGSMELLAEINTLQELLGE